jgi:hypothetical protein
MWGSDSVRFGVAFARHNCLADSVRFARADIDGCCTCGCCPFCCWCAEVYFILHLVLFILLYFLLLWSNLSFLVVMLAVVVLLLWSCCPCCCGLPFS